jgi:dipeptidyl aminopeptidase/acylaminoacyl peptidase
VFLTSTEVHPGERHFYTMSVDGGPRTRITSMTGANEATVSPDERSLAIIHSYSNKPAELYVMPFTAGAPAKQVTTTPTEEWRSFKWIDPKVITYRGRDGADVYARLFTPEMIGAKRDPRRPAVIFVHGAGYLQNAHKYWSSSYYREYMFHNLLASRGYVILDADYHASSGYGRDWRTAIYQHMGGKDLDDIVDGAKFLVATEKVDPKRIGLYGGSYGGFITLMALFTTPDVFAAGAALRPVTDWAHYNHGYTSGILNLPQNDLEAYKRSSPIYFAGGLKGQLLICHGMVDTNVFFQDTVRLMQRLIELRKETWQVAPYPVENHSFTEETSWADEYKRILKLFEDTLRR